MSGEKNTTRYPFRKDTAHVAKALFFFVPALLFPERKRRKCLMPSSLLFFCFFAAAHTQKKEPANESFRFVTAENL